VAGSLSEGGAQLACGAVAVGEEGGIAPHAFHEPGRALPAGFQVAGEVHAAHHALPRVLRRARQQLIAPLRHHVRQ
jgi:hypothetical protein